MQKRKGDEELLDARSQGRKRARAVLWGLVKAGEIPFRCSKCGFIPRGYSGGFENDPALSRGNNLDAQHINKNILDDDPVNLEWLCRSCHKNEDKQTDKGVSLKNDEFGYGDLSILNQLDQLDQLNKGN